MVPRAFPPVLHRPGARPWAGPGTQPAPGCAPHRAVLGWEAPPTTEATPCCSKKVLCPEYYGRGHSKSLTAGGQLGCVTFFLLFPPEFEVQTGNCECCALHRADGSCRGPLTTGCLSVCLWSVFKSSSGYILHKSHRGHRRLVLCNQNFDPWATAAKERLPERPWRTSGGSCLPRSSPHFSKGPCQPAPILKNPSL